MLRSRRDAQRVMRRATTTKPVVVPTLPCQVNARLAAHGCDQDLYGHEDFYSGALSIVHITKDRTKVLEK